MNTNLSAPIPSPRAISGEGWAAIAGAVGSAFLLLKKLVSPKPASKPEPVSRADFYAEMLATRERLHANHLAILEKLDANHRELLAALDRQAPESMPSNPASPAWTSARGRRHAPTPGTLAFPGDHFGARNLVSVAGHARHFTATNKTTKESK